MVSTFTIHALFQVVCNFVGTFSFKENSCCPLKLGLCCEESPIGLATHFLIRIHGGANPSFLGREDRLCEPLEFTVLITYYAAPSPLCKPLASVNDISNCVGGSRGNKSRIFPQRFPNI